MNDLYERIQQLCEEKGVTPYRLASDTGLSRGIFSDLKTGRKRALSAESLQRIADYFGTTVDWLLGGDPAPAAPGQELDEYLEELRTRPELKMFFSLTKNATKEDVQAAVRIVEAFLKDRKGDDSGE